MVVREAGPAASVEAVTQSQQGIFGNRVSFEVGFSIRISIRRASI